MTLRRMIAALCLMLVPAAPAIAQTVSARPAMAKPVLTAWADTTSTTATSSPNEGAYDRLSVGNRKVARAIFESQQAGGTDNLTLDDIAAMKQSGQGGWGRVYKDMQARGLVTDKNLGQAVSRYNRQQHAARSETTTAGNRPAGTSGHGPGGAGGGDHERGSGVHGDTKGAASHGGGHARTVSDGGTSAGRAGHVKGK